MKKWDELTVDQRTDATQRALTALLTDIIEGRMRFDDAKNHDDLQARIDKAGEKADAMRTPWFVHEFIMEDPVLKEALTGVAIASMEDAVFAEQDDLHVACGIL